MSPVPPPAGTYIPSDDWTEDPSFEISPSAQHFALPASPSASSSSSTSTQHSRSPKQVARYHTASPLRNSFTGKAVKDSLPLDGKGTLKLKKREVDQLELDFDLDEDFAPPLLPTHNNHTSSNQRPRSSTASSSSSLITRTVVGTGPTGVGTITRLGSNSGGSSSNGSNLFNLTNKNTVKARALAIEKSWEADVDFDAIDDFEFEGKANTDTVKPLPAAGSSKVKTKSTRLTLSPPRQRGFMPPPDALDDLGFELDGEDEDQATLKAGATIKAMLPPPRPRQPSTIKQSSSATVKAPSTPPAQDPDSIGLEADFALPLNLTNLSLVTQPQPAPRGSRPRSSNASTANTESWDSPGNSGNGKKGGSSGWGWGSDNSPMGGKRRSETSATSISDALPETPVETTNKHKSALELDLDEEEDMEMGLILPSPTFFSNNRATELNSILDRKRRPQFAPSPSHHRTGTEDSRKTGDDSFEDGLVLDEPGVELSRHRLREKKRARDKPVVGSATGSSTRSRLSLGGAAKSVAKEREKAWEKQREQGWGRNTPLSGVRERTQSSLGLSLRSNSASAMPNSRETSTNRSDSPALTGREKESIRSRSGQIHHIMPPPPVPPPVPAQSTLPPTPSTSSRLRHQKSHYHIAPPQSPSLTRKQSLASLQDALGDRTLTPLDTPHHLHHHHNQASSSSNGRYHNSTSRLTMPTSSSKAKIRPAITSIFPNTHSAFLPKNEFPTPSSSASSISSLATPQSYSTTRRGNESHHTEKDRIKRMVDLPRRAKDWGDGTELDSIDDLRVDEEVHNSKSLAGLGLGKPSRRGHEPQNRSTVSAKATDTIATERRKKSGSGPTQTAKRTRTRKPAGLIKHLGGADKKKVVGEMTWNPATLRWEGNESVLRDFDAVSTTSARPALITHYTGSSVGVGGMSSPVGAAGSAGSAPPAPRIVGDMQFDPIHMRWVSILSPEDDEPDPFEGMADDEDEGSGLDGGRGGTITRSAGRKLVTIGSSGHAAGGFGFGFGGTTSVTASTAWSSRLASESSITTSGSIGSSTASTWDDHGHAQSYQNPHHHQQQSQFQHHQPPTGTGAQVSGVVDDELWKECKAAEERHRKEMKGWIMRQPMGREEIRERERKEEKRLWEIRHLAMKS
ncbi:hypothetical protein IAU59_003671 [Kwoniella sp. CBS 9459]